MRCPASFFFPNTCLLGILDLMVAAPRVLLGVSGSIAAYKSVEVCRLLLKQGFDVQVMMTRAAKEFVRPLTFRAITGRPVYSEIFDPEQNGVEHVEQAYEADLVLICPSTAHVLAKLAHGFADDFLTTTCLSSCAPLLLVPAMETQMWASAATQENVRVLKSRGAFFVGPEMGDLASGRSGAGRLSDPESVLAAVHEALGPKDLLGTRVLITAGPTHEPLDPVRFIGNRSTGQMGLALALAAARSGAQVTVVLGPTELSLPRSAAIDFVRVGSAREMLSVCQENLPGQDLVVCAAAVSDYRPKTVSDTKMKKGADPLESVELVENPDVLETLSALVKKHGRKTRLIGFAAETGDLVENARRKLAKKGCHAIVANEVGVERGFGSRETEVTWIAADTPETERFGPASKADIASFLVRKFALLLARDTNALQAGRIP